MNYLSDNLEIIKSLKGFKDFASIQDFDFIVTGSLALLVCGFPIKHHPHDIDIEVRYTSDEHKIELQKLFASLANAYGNDYYKFSEGYGDDEHQKPYIFKFRDTVINVWLVKEFNHKFVFLDYIKFATVRSILEKKMKYQRPKDYQDLNFAISELLKIANG